jgi:hypothetical protein
VTGDGSSHLSADSTNASRSISSTRTQKIAGKGSRAVENVLRDGDARDTFKTGLRHVIAILGPSRRAYAHSKARILPSPTSSPFSLASLSTSHAYFRIHSPPFTSTARSHSTPSIAVLTC